jgi:hypothetical protein
VSFVEFECKNLDTSVRRVPSIVSDRTPLSSSPVVISASSPELSLLQTSLDKVDLALPSTSLLVSEPILDSVIDTLISTLRETTSPTPLHTFWGSEFHDKLVHESGWNQTSVGEGQGKALAWLRGLGLEVSPIKTRSARKKQGLQPFVVDQLFVSSLDMGALRGMKALIRAKS